MTSPPTVATWTKDMEDEYVFQRRSMSDSERDIKKAARDHLWQLVNTYNGGTVATTFSARENVIAALMLFVGVVIWSVPVNRILERGTCVHVYVPSLMYLGVSAAVFLLFGTGVFARHVLRRDARFAGAAPDAPIKERVSALWNNPLLQRQTDFYCAMLADNPFLGNLQWSSMEPMVAIVYKDLASDAARKGAFEQLTFQERVRIICQRVLFKTLSADGAAVEE
jgi:hypothetical protein